jgi:aminocarboxymuconate-semialdehyde decarboxylase
MAEPPRATAGRMYYDDLLYDARAIESLVQLVGRTQVMVGTDYPFSIMDPDPNGRVASLALDPESRRLLCEANALRWLGGAAEG